VLEAGRPLRDNPGSRTLWQISSVEADMISSDRRFKLTFVLLVLS
jgi:hypothetical protein